MLLYCIAWTKHRSIENRDAGLEPGTTPRFQKSIFNCRTLFCVVHTNNRVRRKSVSFYRESGLEMCGAIATVSGYLGKLPFITFILRRGDFFSIALPPPPPPLHFLNWRHPLVYSTYISKYRKFTSFTCLYTSWYPLLQHTSY